MLDKFSYYSFISRVLSILTICWSVSVIATSVYGQEVQVKKYYEIGSQKTIKPNELIAARMISVGSGQMAMHSNWQLIYLGRASESIVNLQIKTQKLEAYKSSRWVEEPRSSITVYLEKDKATVCDVGGLTLGLEVSGSNLICTVLGDVDTPFNTGAKKCKNGHEWFQDNYNFCPICGQKLE